MNIQAGPCDNLCSSCDYLESCTKFDWLRDAGTHMKAMLKENRGRSKDEYIRAINDRLP